MEIKIKNINEPLLVPKFKLKSALRTLTGIKKIKTESVDYVVIDPPSNFERILQLSKWKGSFDWSIHRENVRRKTSNLVVGRRFRANSKNTHHFAFYSMDGMVSPHTFKLKMFSNNEETKLQSLILNSSITIANMLSFREQTTGGFADIMESELVSFDVFNFAALDSSSRKESSAVN